MLEKYFARPLIRGLLKLLYRVEITGLEHYQAAGDRVIIICNHVSYLDPVILGAFLPEKPRYAINVFQLKKWYFRWLEKAFTLYPLDPSQPISMKNLIKDLRDAAKVVVFPEGRISTSAGIMKIYDGTSMLVNRTECTLLPVRIDGPERSPFSRTAEKNGRCWFPKIRLTILPPKPYRQDDITSAQDIYDIMTCAAYATARSYNTTLDALFSAAKRYGRKHEIIMDGVSRDCLNYGHVLTRGFVLAGALKKPLDAEKHVGVLLPTSAGGALTFIALQILNKIPCLLNFSAGNASVLHACNLAQVRVILTSRSFVEKGKLENLLSALSDHHTIVYLEDLRGSIRLKDKLCGLWKSFSPRRHVKHMHVMQHHNPAVILYTSGSEGVPKGVALSHHNILSNISQFNAVLDINASDSLFNALPMFHSFGLTVGTLTPLICGIRAVLYPSPLHYRIVPELIYDTDSTIILGTDTFYNGYARNAHPYDFWRVRLAVAGAEKLKDATRALYQERFGLNITEGYGVTEASPVLSVNTALCNKKGSVGRLLPGIRHRVDSVEGLDIGGRLSVSGPNVMLGYLLADAPGVIQPHGEWYDTGDIVDVDKDGYITILGRAKRFAKIAGEMVSLTAVEDLASHVGGTELTHAAITAADARKGERITLITESETVTREALQEYAKNHGISELNIPRKIIHSSEVPRLGNGKIDYLLLQEHYGTAAD